MAIYHLHLSNGSKSKGASAQIRHDYVMREGDYTSREEELVFKEDGNLPDWAASARDFWTTADAQERANSRVYREFEMALPRELNKEQQIELAREFARDFTAHYKLAYSMAIHSDKGHNPHIHLMYSERVNDGVERARELHFKRADTAQPWKGGAAKASEMRGKLWLTDVRQQWEISANVALERAQRPERIDARSYAEQGIERTPQVHLGVQACAMARRGIDTERMAWHREIEQLRRMEHELAKLEAMRTRLQQDRIREKERSPSPAQQSNTTRDTEQNHGRHHDHENTRQPAYGRTSSEVDRADVTGASRHQEHTVPTAHVVLPEPKEHGAMERARRQAAQAGPSRDPSGVSQPAPRASSVSTESRRDVELSSGSDLRTDARAPKLEHAPERQPPQSQEPPASPGQGQPHPQQSRQDVDLEARRDSARGESSERSDGHRSRTLLSHLSDERRAAVGARLQAIMDEHKARSKAFEREQRHQEIMQEVDRKKGKEPQHEKALLSLEELSNQRKELVVQSAEVTLRQWCFRQKLTAAPEPQAQRAEVLKVQEVEGQRLVALKEGNSYHVVREPVLCQREYKIEDEKLTSALYKVNAELKPGDVVEYYKDRIRVGLQESRDQRRALERQLREQEWERRQARHRGRGGPDFDM